LTAGLRTSRGKRLPRSPNGWERRLYGIAELANKIAVAERMPADALQKDIDLIRESYPEFRSIYVADAAGATVAYTLRGDLEGETTTELNFSGRPYFAELRARRRPVISDVLRKESLDGADRVKMIVQNLKSFSRLDEAELKMADINTGIESTLAIVWNELKYKATVKKEYGDLPLTRCNLGELNQVFMNLLVNAAQAIDTKGEIIVRTGRENGSIFVTISDTGCGIPADRMNRIFEPFFTTKEVGKGTGLGLSIAYEIVKKHNGELSVQSEPGLGTIFRVTIPVVNG
jgi:signal transduction histidine kinase